MPLLLYVTPEASLIGSRLTPPPGSAETLPMMWKMGSMGCSAFGWQASGSAAAGSGAVVAAAASSAAAARAGARRASFPVHREPLPSTSQTVF